MAKLNQIKTGNFQSEHLKVCKLLDDCLYAVFPKQDYIANNLKGLPLKDKIYVNYYNKAFLPYHTRDTYWLASYLDQIYYSLECARKTRLQGTVTTNVKRLPLKLIQEYIENSPKFDVLRCQYEHNLVQAYILVTRNTETDDFYMKSLSKVRERCDENYDELFRERVIGAMKYLGVDAYNAEVGLEINGELWQHEVRTQTFVNRYHAGGLSKLISYNGTLATHLPNKWKRLSAVENKFFICWSMLREYEYFSAHREIINRLGTYNSKVRLTPEKAQKLAVEVNSLGFEYECLLADAVQSIDSVNKKVKDMGFSK